MDEVRYCSTCKFENNKITEEPCMICSPWCDKWQSKTIPNVVNVLASLSNGGDTCEENCM